VRIGSILLALGRSDRVKLAIRHALDRQPHAPQLLSFSAIALERSGKIDEALRTLREARRQAPHELELAATEATILIRNGDRDRGTRLMRLLVEATSAPNEDSLYLLGQVYRRAGDTEAAVETMQRIIRDAPDSARALNSLAYMFAERGTHLDDAENLSRRALAIEPRSGAVLDSLGYVCFRRGKLEEAERYLLRASRLQPGDAEVLEHLGDVLLARGKPEPAREAYVRARAALDRAVIAKEPHAAADQTRVRKKLAELPGPARAEP
jgi:Flp pilus assembly protein TadD